MRWLALLIVSIAASITLGAADPALALPQAEAEAAYASGDYATAFKLWLPLAEQGSARAQTNIARMYERGEWVAPDKAMAEEWYRRAAEQSAADAAMPAMAMAPASSAPSAASAVSPPVQTIYTPPPAVSRPPPVSYPPASYPIVVPNRATAHHHHHGHRH